MRAGYKNKIGLVSAAKLEWSLLNGRLLFVVQLFDGIDTNTVLNVKKRKREKKMAIASIHSVCRVENCVMGLGFSQNNTNLFM